MPRGQFRVGLLLQPECPNDFYGGLRRYVQGGEEVSAVTLVISEHSMLEADGSSTLFRALSNGVVEMKTSLSDLWAPFHLPKADDDGPGDHSS
jgi:hypothetical protein